ncbi:hypothetical protein PHYC_02196 [Phycisphaerales bacterium]|nr:hypothetical protein PHYC_02196 [Phycisphaerales bacterium]
MSSKPKPNSVKADGESRLVPKLRFPAFRAHGPWRRSALATLCERIIDKVGDLRLTPVSITAGRGFVAQAEKFGRDISGEQYKNYIHIRNGDFAYNKGNSNLYPQGCVYRLKEFGEAAASNAFICFRLWSGLAPGFFEGLFERNEHGWQLIRFLTSGARSDGLLNIKPEEFFSVEFPLPPRLAEQERIAECRNSLNELIAAQSRKVDTLRAHRRGLMRHLFPQEGQRLPRLRFPQFRNRPEWEQIPLGDLFETMTGGTPDRAVSEYWGGSVPWITTSLVDFNVIDSAEEFITEAGVEHSSAKRFPKNTVLVALYGQGKTRGKVAMLGIEATTNQACAAILPHPDVEPSFTFLSLCARYDEVRSLSNSGGQENLSQGLIRALPFYYPKERAEQQRIADCLGSLDAAIAAEVAALAALKVHKSGLMQGLFPSPEGA